ncbi:hypothetical protein [Campylobacter ureolyticus]|uniref:hypothetical protein n=1 Tax=Campylobacter ureolyticus TaxID=827 RepID=UPI00215A9518|nr:hypothetical protein [Campylobacter ureolyticus]MCR8699140.1 hypothetical protein [Campylobacter ureolyticus]
MKKILVFLFVLVFGLGGLNAFDKNYRYAKPENMKVEFIKEMYKGLLPSEDEYNRWEQDWFYSPELNFLVELNWMSGEWLDYNVIMQGQDINFSSMDEIKITQLKNGNVRVSFDNSILDFYIICTDNLEKGNDWGDDDECFIDDIFEYDSETKKFKSLKNFYINSIKNNKDVNKFLNTFKFAN